MVHYQQLPKGAIYLFQAPIQFVGNALSRHAQLPMYALRTALWAGVPRHPKAIASKGHSSKLYVDLHLLVSQTSHLGRIAAVNCKLK